MQDRKPSNLRRRQFVIQTGKLVALGSLVGSFAPSCKNKKGPGETTGNTDTTSHKGQNSGTHRPRKKWNREALVLNKKTNVLHYPTALVYTYYDEIKSGHLQEVPSGTWNPFAGNAPRLNRQQSGTILEILSLKELSKGVNDISLAVAIDTLSQAFDDGYEKANTLNFRVHELMLQYVALCNAIPADQKWVTFSAKVKKPSSLRKRQKWMETEQSFSERIKYITDRKDEYMSRLGKRAARFA